jgi:hypothetical protein
MKTERTLVADRCFLGTVLLFFGFGLSGLSTMADAQVCTSVQGYNAVWGTCPSNHQLEIVGSPAFIDASAFCPNSPNCDGADFCHTVSQALAVLPANGGVIDARGVRQHSGLISDGAIMRKEQAIGAVEIKH